MPELPVSLSVITFKDKSVIINEMSFLLRGLCSGPCHCFKLDPRGLDFTTGKSSVLLSLCVSFFLSTLWASSSVWLQVLSGVLDKRILQTAEGCTLITEIHVERSFYLNSSTSEHRI